MFPQARVPTYVLKDPVDIDNYQHLMKGNDKLQKKRMDNGMLTIDNEYEALKNRMFKSKKSGFSHQKLTSKFISFKNQNQDHFNNPKKKTLRTRNKLANSKQRKS